MEGTTKKPIFDGATPQERKTNAEAKELGVYNEFTADCSPLALMQLIPANVDWVRAFKLPDGTPAMQSVKNFGWPKVGSQCHATNRHGLVEIETFDRIDFADGHIHGWVSAADHHPDKTHLLDTFEDNFCFNAVEGNPNQCLF